MQNLQNNLLSADVRASWLRSEQSYGLNPDNIVEPDVLTHTELIARRAPLEDLNALSSPEIERLLSRLSDHAQLVMMSDSEGLVIQYRAKSEALDACSNFRVLPGSIWSEERQGTTGVGLCLLEKKPLSIVMGEHYARSLEKLSCTVAPIFGQDGQLAGVLNATSIKPTSHEMQAVIREMVINSAQRIENIYFDQRNTRYRVLRISRHDDFCDGAAEARIAIDDNGRIVDITPYAEKMLGQSQRLTVRGSLIGQKLSTVIGIENIERWLSTPKPSTDHPNGRLSFKLNADHEVKRNTQISAIGTTQNSLKTQKPASIKQSIDIEEIIGQEPSLRSQIGVIQRMYSRGLPLLLQGESGSGKTQLARSLHDSGPNSHGNFISINCAAIPQELIESELFGYRAGAFTGASKTGSPGRIVAANGGTLFLDEIGDMPFTLQARLLQVLSEGEFVPVGSIEPVRVKFSLISATLRDLSTMVKEGKFREDLYYRISGATLTLPPLRERHDRAELIKLAFQRAADEAGQGSRNPNPDALNLLINYPWPGNQRELQHVARFSTALCDSGEIGPECLPPQLTNGSDQLRHKTYSLPNTGNTSLTKDRSAIIEALEKTGWNISLTAEKMGISRATLHRRLNDLKISRNESHET